MRGLAAKTLVAPSLMRLEQPRAAVLPNPINKLSPFLIIPSSERHRLGVNLGNKTPKAHWRWHLDEVFVPINGETHYFWRAVDHEGEVLEVFATKRRDRNAALKFLKRTMKRYGQPRSIVTDRLRSYRSAMKVIGNAADQECGRWLNNRAENSHQPFRRRERAMAKFRGMKTLQKFAAAHASIYNHFNNDRHLNRRNIFKQNRAAALAEWRQLAA